MRCRQSESFRPRRCLGRCTHPPRWHRAAAGAQDHQGQRTAAGVALAAMATSQPQPSSSGSSNEQHLGQRQVARPFGQTLVQGFLDAAAPHLPALAPRHAIMLLEVCATTGSSPPAAWLENLYATWPAQDAAAPHMWPHTLRLLSLLGRVGVAPPRDFLDTIYYAVGARCTSDFELSDVSAFLLAASQFCPRHPVDRDLMLSLTPLLLVNDAARLRSATPQQVTELLPCIVAAGHAPGMPMTAAVLGRLLPHLAHTSCSQLPDTASESKSGSARPAAGATDVISLHALLRILEAAVGPAVNSQLPATLEPPAAAAIISQRLHFELPGLPASDTVRCLVAMGACRLPACTELIASKVLPALVQDLRQLPPHQLSPLAVALHRLGIVPNQAWAEAFHAALFAQLDRFEDSDALVEALDALTAMDRQAGFKALNQLAQQTALQAKASNTASTKSSAQLKEARRSSGRSVKEEEGDLALRLVNTLLVLGYLNHNPGYEPVQVLIKLEYKCPPFCYGYPSNAAAPLLLAAMQFLGLISSCVPTCPHSCHSLPLSAHVRYLIYNSYHLLSLLTNQAIAGVLQPHLPSLSGQQLTNVLWSLAHMNRTPSQPRWLEAAKAAASIQLRSGSLKPYQMAFVFGSLQSIGATLDAAWVEEMLERVRAQLPAMPSHDVALVLHTVSRLQHVTSYAWMADVEAHVSLRLDSYQPKEITTVVYAMAKLHHRPPSEWLQAVEDNFFDQLPSFSADNIVTLLSSLLEMGHTPGTVFLDGVCSSSETQLQSLDSVQLVTLLSCLGKAKSQPETEWLARYLSVLLYHLPSLDASSFSSVVQSLALMEAQVSSDEWWAIFCRTMKPRLGSMDKADLLAAVAALPGCGLRNPPAQWSQALAERVLGLACSKSLTPDEAERFVVAMGALGVPPPRQLLDDFLGSSLPHLASLPPTRIARLVGSFSRAGVLPSRKYLEGLVTAARASVYSFTMLELVELTQGLSQLNSRSPQPVPAVSDFLALVKEWL